MSDLSVKSVQPNMYKKNALVAFLICGSGYASYTTPNMSLSHFNLTELPRALDSSLCGSSGDTPNTELTRDTTLSIDKLSVDTDLTVTGIPRMVPTSSKVIDISLHGMWKVLVLGYHLSTEVKTTFLLINL